MKILCMSAAALLLAACASRPIVDTQGVNMANYERDLAQCQAYADQVNTGGDVAKGAAGGAIFGGILGAIFGNSGTVARGAGAGAVIGGAQGAGKGENEKDRVIKTCLRGRGYKVLN